jgi:hypothetical protein
VIEQEFAIEFCPLEQIELFVVMSDESDSFFRADYDAFRGVHADDYTLGSR